MNIDSSMRPAPVRQKKADADSTGKTIAIEVPVDTAEIGDRIWAAADGVGNAGAKTLRAIGIGTVSAIPIIGKLLANSVREDFQSGTVEKNGVNQISSGITSLAQNVGIYGGLAGLVTGAAGFETVGTALLYTSAAAFGTAGLAGMATGYSTSEALMFR